MNEYKIKERFSQGKDFLLLQEKKGSVIGCVLTSLGGVETKDSINPADELWYIGLLSILPSHQGKGLGTYLTTKAEAHIQKKCIPKYNKSIKYIELQVLSLHPFLYTMYSKLGYVEVRRGKFSKRSFKEEGETIFMYKYF